MSGRYRSIRAGLLSRGALSAFLFFVSFFVLLLLGAGNSLFAAVFLAASFASVIINFKLCGQFFRKRIVLILWISALPVYTLASTFWSEYPAATLRSAVQLTLTIVLSVFVYGALNGRRSIYLIFLGLILTAFFSLIFNRGHAGLGGMLGIFGSKNAFSCFSAIFFFVALSVFLNGKNSFSKMFAFIILLFAGYLLLRGDSAGAIVLTFLISIAALVAHLCIRMNKLNRGFAFLSILMAFIPISAVILLTLDDYFVAVLSFLGKDTTLTGRTDLWSFANYYISEKPMFGTGYNAFWVRGKSEAEALWLMFSIETRTGFHFHNLFLSNAVELGLVGVGLQVSYFLWAMILAAKSLMKRYSAETLAYSLIFLFLLIRTWMEVDLFYPFNYITFLFFVGLCRLNDDVSSRRVCSK